MLLWRVMAYTCSPGRSLRHLAIETTCTCPIVWRLLIFPVCASTNRSPSSPAGHGDRQVAAARQIADDQAIDVHAGAVPRVILGFFHAPDGLAIRGDQVVTGGDLLAAVAVHVVEVEVMTEGKEEAVGPPQIQLLVVDPDVPAAAGIAVTGYDVQPCRLRPQAGQYQVIVVSAAGVPGLPKSGPAGGYPVSARSAPSTPESTARPRSIIMTRSSTPSLSTSAILSEPEITFSAHGRSQSTSP